MLRNYQTTMEKHKWMWIVWPAFLVAAGLEMLVFSVVDPQDLQWFGRPLTLSRQAVYTLAFFAFWALAATSSALSVLLATPSDEVNAQGEQGPARADQR